MINFTNSFADYGTIIANYDEEIRRGLLEQLTIETSSVSFNRSLGLGIDLYENETFNEVTKLRLAADIVMAAERYNQTTIPEKQIIIGQEMVEVEQDVDGNAYITIYYIQLKDLPNPQNAIRSISIPL